MTEHATPAALAGLDALAPDPPLAGAPPAPAGVPTGALLRLAAGLAGHPLAVGRRAAALAGDLLRVGLGAADPDPALPPGPALRRLVQAHRAGRATAAALLADAGLDPADRARLDAVLTAVDDLVEAVLPGTRAPSPAPPRPRGGRRAPVVGEDVAATPGAVVLRTPAFELIQYLPRTEAVRAVPVLLVPSLTNRHYLTDLAPGRSLVEHLVAGGQQVLALSWWNPRAEHADRGLDAYARAVLEAVEACERITRAPSLSLVATGSGATIVAALLAHLAAAGSGGRAASLTLLLPALGRPGPPAPPPAPGASAELRWWAGDTLRVPAALHDDLTAIAARDALAQPGGVRVLGTPVDLAKVDTDAYVVAGEGGPWAAAYRSAALLSGDTRFVLAPGGPVEALIAPPGGDRSFRAGPPAPADPDDWLPTAVPTPGSWWTDHLRWLDERGGARVDAPPELGGRGLHALAPTPGDYVLSR